MNDDVIADLKQFIAATVSQSIAPIDQKVTSLAQNVSLLREEMQQGFASIGDITTEHSDTLDNHELRLAKLEVQA